MAGHSHWAGIKHRKAAVDAKRGKVFSKLAKAIISAAREGGGDPALNLKLRYAVEKARDANMPRDTIARAVKRGTGELGGEQIQELTYEGYGPGGAALLIQTITDNPKRTGPDLRHLIEKRGGSLGKPGSVAWNFELKALFTVPTGSVHEDTLLEAALEAGADDVTNEGASFAVTGAPETFGPLEEKLAAIGVRPETSDLTFLPKSRVMLSAQDARKLIEIIEALEDHDDVQSAITNGDIPDEVLAELGA
ncbi:MAG: YebC/PmpR family DNA-binding transcriptional regulator [Planctomycetota bacterium]